MEGVFGPGDATFLQRGPPTPTSLACVLPGSFPACFGTRIRLDCGQGRFIMAHILTG
jgi:hypothetical protein